MVNCFVNLRMFAEWVWLKILSRIKLVLKIDNRYSAWDKAVLGTTYEEWFRCMELDRMQEP